MVTVVDPAGTPAPVYNRSGVSIVTATANVPATPGQIPNAVSGHTVVIASRAGQSGSEWLRLPTNCEIGDVVEVFGTNVGTDPSIDVIPPVGESFSNGNNPTLGGGQRGCYCRKVDTSTWGYL